MVKIQYSKKFDKLVSSELKKDNIKILNKELQNNKIILTLEKYPTKNQKILKSDWEMC